ncbi:MAG: hypothetical protein WAL63_11030 [Solirubrobacteraceae bacterium]
MSVRIGLPPGLLAISTVAVIVVLVPVLVSIAQALQDARGLPSTRSRRRPP